MSAGTGTWLSVVEVGGVRVGGELGNAVAAPGEGGAVGLQDQVVVGAGGDGCDLRQPRHPHRCAPVDGVPSPS